MSRAFIHASGNGWRISKRMVWAAAGAPRQGLGDRQEAAMAVKGYVAEESTADAARS